MLSILTLYQICCLFGVFHLILFIVFSDNQKVFNVQYHLRGVYYMPGTALGAKHRGSVLKELPVREGGTDDSP